MLVDFLFRRMWNFFPRNLLLKLLNLILDTLVERWVVEGGRGLLIKWIIPLKVDTTVILTECTG